LDLGEWEAKGEGQRRVLPAVLKHAVCTRYEELLEMLIGALVKKSNHESK
jgi:hypothetical protein